MDPLVKAFNEFSVKLYKHLIEDNQKNTAFSPLSIASALTMVYLGARGNTEVQMAEVLNFKKAAEQKPSSMMAQTKLQNTCAAHLQNIPQAFEELFLNVNKSSNKYILKSANGLYYEKSFHFLKQYIQQIKKSFHAEIQAVNFVESAEEERKKINAWIEQKTEGKIKEILAQGVIDSATKLVLVNALYFKGNWAVKFQEENTEERPFRLSKTKTKSVPMMFLRSKCKMFYIEELETKVLELPYVKRETTMILLLPDDINDNSTGLEKLQEELCHEKLNQWTRDGMMEETEVEIEIPRFKLEASTDLKPYLRKMGMSDLFEESKADLTGISAADNIYVSEICHKIFVEVNEEGTEAAAATAAVVTVRSRPIVDKFQADHPFIFCIKQMETQAILFLGSFISP
ncbi:serpin B6-like [Gastrophryne carolinensis]